MQGRVAGLCVHTVVPSYDESREIDPLLEGRWGFPDHLHDGRESAWQLGELAAPQAPGTVQGKVPRSKAVA